MMMMMMIIIIIIIIIIIVVVVVVAITIIIITITITIIIIIIIIIIITTTVTIAIAINNPCLLGSYWGYAFLTLLFPGDDNVVNCLTATGNPRAYSSGDVVTYTSPSSAGTQVG
jgi:hypothetical protein